MKIKKVIIIGGLHGDEPSGIKIARYFSGKSVSIKGLVCNLGAVGAKKRFLETDLNRSFNSYEPISYEEKKAFKIRAIVSRYDLIIDFHNTKAIGTTCAITVCQPNTLHLNLTSYFGFKRLVIMPPSGSLIAIKPDNAISFEIAGNSVSKFPEKKLIEKIKKINNDLKIRDLPRHKIEIYEYVNKVEKRTFERLKLKKSEFSNFKKLNTMQIRKFGLKGRYYCPIFFKRYQDESIVFTLIRKIDIK